MHVCTLYFYPQFKEEIPEVHFETDTSKQKKKEKQTNKYLKPFLSRTVSTTLLSFNNQMCLR